MNTGILLSVSACLFAQALKAIGVSYMYGRIRLKPFFSSGGMPSSHSALVTCMACWTMYSEGVNSGAACVAVCVAMIVCYDASHVRLEVGKHASQINRILSTTNNGSRTRSPTRRRNGRYQTGDVEVAVDIESNNYDDNDDDSAPLVDTQHGENVSTMKDLSQAASKLLEEAVGHTKIEVVAGVGVGILWFLIWLPVLMFT
jgi:acid phosphatase family membrane protein YuiD